MLTTAVAPCCIVLCWWCIRHLHNLVIRGQRENSQIHPACDESRELHEGVPLLLGLFSLSGQGLTQARELHQLRHLPFQLHCQLQKLLPAHMHNHTLSSGRERRRSSALLPTPQRCLETIIKVTCAPSLAAFFAASLAFSALNFSPCRLLAPCCSDGLLCAAVSAVCNFPVENKLSHVMMLIHW